MTVVYDPTLRVGVSARPFATRHDVGRRLSMAWTTFGVEFASDPPLRRRRRRRQWERGPRRGPGA
ncbi:hypothetical protein ACTWLI_04360 [Arthrobacter sp. Hor0625]|uniref:hypothetical protein n=1 Tax=Arthrobacter sp. Hor0625 TaxID=3457358 RepID=UPI00403E6436